MAKKRTRGRFTYAEDRKLIQMAAGSATLDEAAVTLRTSAETIERGAKRLGLLLVEPDGQKRLSSGLGQVNRCMIATRSNRWTPTEDDVFRKMAEANIRPEKGTEARWPRSPLNADGRCQTTRANQTRPVGGQRSGLSNSPRRLPTNVACSLHPFDDLSALAS